MCMSALYLSGAAALFVTVGPQWLVTGDQHVCGHDGDLSGTRAHMTPEEARHEHATSTSHGTMSDLWLSGAAAPYVWPQWLATGVQHVFGRDGQVPALMVH